MNRPFKSFNNRDESITVYERYEIHIHIYIHVYI